MTLKIDTSFTARKKTSFENSLNLLSLKLGSLPLSLILFFYLLVSLIISICIFFQDDTLAIFIIINTIIRMTKRYDIVAGMYPEYSYSGAILIFYISMI